MSFELHPNLHSKTFITDLSLCRILLEDEANYLWLLLVPRRPHISRIMDLTSLDQLQLLQELDLAQKILWETFHPTQLNVAAIGNKTPQLHVHVIARQTEDPAWPHTVWDHPTRIPYSATQKNTLISQLQLLFQ
jgi:diadenosine tetraphosphate (Ap4A) HIT family hydrolase